MDHGAATVLKQAMAKIRQGWCKGHLAIDAHGNEVDSRSRKAVAWCALGALEFADFQFTTNAVRYLRVAVGRENQLLAPWNNDAKRKATIIAGFKKAIRLAESVNVPAN